MNDAELLKDADPVRRAAEDVLAGCLSILTERGAQHGNSTLEDSGPLTGRPPLEILLGLVEMKVSRLGGQVRRERAASGESEPMLAKGLSNPATQDTVADLVNYLALMMGRVRVVNLREADRLAAGR